MTKPATATGTLTQKTEDQLEDRQESATDHGPSPKPRPEMAAHIPNAPARRSTGYVSVRMAKRQGRHERAARALEGAGSDERHVRRREGAGHRADA